MIVVGALAPNVSQENMRLKISFDFKFPIQGYP